MKFFAAIGIAIATLAIANSIGIGHFVLIYGPAKIECVKEAA